MVFLYLQLGKKRCRNTMCKFFKQATTYSVSRTNVTLKRWFILFFLIPSVNIQLKYFENTRQYLNLQKAFRAFLCVKRNYTHIAL